MDLPGVAGAQQASIRPAQAVSLNRSLLASITGIAKETVERGEVLDDIAADHFKRHSRCDRYNRQRNCISSVRLRGVTTDQAC